MDRDRRTGREPASPLRHRPLRRGRPGRRPDELRWDLRALDAAESITDEQTADAGMGDSAAGYFPSLHLNLGECYRKIGDFRRARTHQDHGRQATAVLPPGDYGAMIRDCLDGLARRLDA